jgi:OmpA-OmpF porin, OOP family
MSRSELRTREGWGAFDLWAWIIGILLLLLTLFLYFNNRGKPGYEDCCNDKAVATAVAPAAAPSVAPAVVPAPEPAKVEAPVVAAAPAPAPEPAKAAEPVVDCAKIMEGVTINFEVNGSALTAAGKRALDQVVKCLTANKYEVAGHTDSDGGDDYNQKLSERRAGSVVAYLTSKSVPAAKMVAAGYGEKKPVVDNNTTENKAKNRRITFTPQ